MEFNPFNDDHKAFRETVRSFAQKEMAPFAEQWDEEGTFPNQLFKKAADLGLLGIRVSPEYGGSGLDWWFTTCMVEELCHSGSGGVNMALMVQTDMATPIIEIIGTEEQKKLFLEPAVKGEKIAALGISEPGGGSDVAAIKTTARADGDDYVINGQKLWITSGARADFITLAARTGEDGFGGVSLFTFPTDTPGFSVGRVLKKVGNLASDTTELFFEECRIPRRYILGKENQGFYHIMTNFQGERLVAAISTVSAMEKSLKDAIQYGNERSAFGRPISKFQVWKHRFVEMQTQIEAAKWLTYRAVDLINNNKPAVKEITMAKLFAGDLAQKIIYDCMQVYGGFGYTTEFQIGRTWRDMRLITIGGGTSEIMKEILIKMQGL